MAPAQRGKLIVLYGVNNLGKTTQAKLLVEKLSHHGVFAEYIKYPIYELPPTGHILNTVLRSGTEQKLSEIELQKLYAQNRRDFQPTLEQKLVRGKWIVAEDYTGTGLAWGVTKGAPLDILEKQNNGLIQEDCAVLLDGDRFLSGKEARHLHESNDSLMQHCRATHRALAQKYSWLTVDANQSVEDVAENIWKIIQTLL